MAAESKTAMRLPGSRSPWGDRPQGLLYSLKSHKESRGLPQGAHLQQQTVERKVQRAAASVTHWGRSPNPTALLERFYSLLLYPHRIHCYPWDWRRPSEPWQWKDLCLTSLAPTRRAHVHAHTQTCMPACTRAHVHTHRGCSGTPSPGNQCVLASCRTCRTDWGCVGFAFSPPAKVTFELLAWMFPESLWSDVIPSVYTLLLGHHCPHRPWASRGSSVNTQLGRWGLLFLWFKTGSKDVGSSPSSGTFTLTFLYLPNRRKDHILRTS